MKARTALTLYLAAKLAAAKGRLVWSSSAAEYFDDSDGSQITGRDLRHRWDQTLAQAEKDVTRLTDRMLSRRISVERYRSDMAGIVKDLTRAGYMAGRGGRAQMTPADWGKVGAECERQYRYLDKFTHALANGTAGSEAKIRQRARLYAEAGYSMAEAGHRISKELAGYTEERRNAVMDQGTCDECARLAGLGWRPVGSLPLPGEGTPCGPNCRCSMEYKGNPIMREEESAYLVDKIRQQFAEAGDVGLSYNVHTHDEPAEGFALSIYPERTVKVPANLIQAADINQFAEDNADLLRNRDKFDRIFGAWAEPGDNVVLDVSVVIPADQVERAAKLTVEHNQDAMWSLHEGRLYNNSECRQIAGEEKSMARRREPAFFIDPNLPGSKDPATGRKRTYADYMATLVEACEHLHKHHGAVKMDRRHLQEFVITEYRKRTEDIEEFWQLRPDLKPADWAEQKDVYMDAHRAHWEKLAW